MQVTCQHCSRILDYSSDRPHFCGFCGKPIPADDTDNTALFTPNTAARLSPSTRETIPQTLGGYCLIKELGSGGMGTVYEAEDRASGRRVAVKLISADFAHSAETVERFRQEGRLASAIAHPRCVFVLAAEEEAGRPYIVMELMPGSTLKDLVEKEGPLPEERAVSLILDVIDGLEEAHRSGVIHRDVKPSNCFLEADGRVKVGDFGLSKSLAGEGHLTRTGTFLGTPLFASPEQVRGEAVDYQTDVYSVAATLYFLLTGRAPFQSKDAAITLTRLVSEPAPPLRTLRPELSSGLERVAMRGLERQRERRWRSMEALRTALLAFIPGRLSIGSMGMRLAAYFLDFVLLAPLTWLAIFLVFKNFSIHPESRLGIALEELAPPVLSIIYYGLLEGLWGCSLGKLWLRLRVCALANTDPPGISKAFFRALIWHVCLGGPSLVVGFYYPSAQIGARPLLAFLHPLAAALGVLFVVSTMRAKNGYRGPHELVTGTRVIQLPWAKRTKVYRGRSPEAVITRPVETPVQMGSFTVQGTLGSNPSDAAEVAKLQTPMRNSRSQNLGYTDSQVLAAQDMVLNRKVWIWLRPVSDPPLPPVRREVARSTRLRWLSCGRFNHSQWDAFLAPPGTILTDLEMKSSRMDWAEARPLLEQLADELTAAGADGTLPSTLTTDQVWVEPNGRLHLLDMPLQTNSVSATSSSTGTNALGLLAQVTIFLLEGHPRRAGAPSDPVRAPVPLHAAKCLARLVGAAIPYKEVKQFQADLAVPHDLAVEVSRSRRLAHIGILLLLLSPALFLWLAIPLALTSRTLPPNAKVLFVASFIALWPTVWIVWAFCTRGGFSHGWAGLALRRMDGARPSRWCCAWRVFLFWLLPVSFLALSMFFEEWSWSVQESLSIREWLHRAFWWAAWLLWPIYAMLALVSPARSLHDRLAGTCLVPK